MSGDEASVHWVDGETSFFEGDYSEEVWLVWFGEYEPVCRTRYLRALTMVCADVIRGRFSRSAVCDGIDRPAWVLAVVEHDVLGRTAV